LHDFNVGVFFSIIWIIFDKTVAITLRQEARDFANVAGFPPLSSSTAARLPRSFCATLRNVCAPRSKLAANSASLCWENGLSPGWHAICLNAIQHWPMIHSVFSLQDDIK
jgi:hypothetical protein